MIQILSRRTKNNPVLIGEPGVGKTAIAEGLAQKIVAADVPEELLDKRILTLDLSGMVAGTKYRGEFEDRIKKALDEVKKDGSIILFIDELHTIVGAGSAGGRHGRGQHHQARPGPRRDPRHRRDDPERVSQIYRKGRRPGAPLPACHGGRALRPRPASRS